MPSDKKNNVSVPGGEPADRPFFVRHHMFFVVLVIAAGMMIRLAAYLHNRSLWLDEAFIACSVVTRSFLELLQPLEFNQGAPIGWLYLVRTATGIFGPSEYALRLVSLLAGLAALPLFYVLAKKYVERTSALIGLTVFAISENLIYYSNELKQYGLDVVVSILLLIAVEPVLQGKAKPKHWAILAIGGGAAIWFSHPAIFVLAGIGTAIAAHSLWQRDWRRLGVISLSGAAWLASFGINYFLFTRNLAENPGKLSAFGHTFMPMVLSLDTLEWIRSAISDLSHSVLDLPTSLGCAFIASVGMIGGAIRLFTRDKARGFVMILPLAFCMVASGLQKYPFKGRLVLFMAPMLLILTGFGMHWFVSSRRRLWVRILGGIALVFLIAMPIREAVPYIFTGSGNDEVEQVRPILEYVLENEKAEDVVFIYKDSWPACLYYRETYGYEPNRYIRGHNMPEDDAEYLAHLKQLFEEEGHRIWFIISHDEGNPRKRLVKMLDQIATCLDSIKVDRGYAYLYKYTALPDAETRKPEHGESNDEKQK